MEYREFIASKHLRVQRTGFDVDESQINGRLFDWQRKVVKWAVNVGRAALFEECGLGKTIQQLEWAKLVHQHTSEPVLLLCPLAVQWQTIAERLKFEIDAESKIVETQADCINGINVSNYEKLHHFDAKRFAGVVLDESSVLKSFTGSTKRQLCEDFAETPFKLACTATPAPNDRMELGNHAEFLGVMPSNEMLARWFINDGAKVGSYRLCKHAETDFWRWMASWSMCLSSPADIGFDATGYTLPPLNMHDHIIASKPFDGCLFVGSETISATEVHKEKRAALTERADCAAGLVNGDSDCWIVWCDTDYEADALIARIPDAIEVRGSHPASVKSSRLRDFAEERARVLITKAELAGFGMNFQHCHKTTWFAGYSYEKWHQAIRRLWRFGQTMPVDVHVIRTEREESIVDAVNGKGQSHAEMAREMARLMSSGMLEELNQSRKLETYDAAKRIALPSWIKSKA